MECSLMTNDHWVTEPKWNRLYHMYFITDSTCNKLLQTVGRFCFCPNASNNTYWCIRKINDQENILYCEFITGYISFYDLNKDPYQVIINIDSRCIYNYNYSTTVTQYYTKYRI